MSRSKKDAEKAQSLTEERLKEYALFRHNLRLLRANIGLSAEALGKDLNFPKHHRVIDLEAGRVSRPNIDEIKRIAEYFKITIDTLLYQKAIISFTNN